MTNPPFIQAGDVAIYAPKLNLNDGVDGAIVAQLCVEVSDMARRFCDREWWIQSYTEQYWGKNNVSLMLKHRPITAITTLTVTGCGGNTVLSPATTDTNGNPIPQMGGYWTDGKAVYLGYGCRFADSTTPNIFISYTAGYASLTGGPSSTPDYTSIPTDLKMALIKEVIFRKTESQRVGIRSVSDGNQQTSSYMTGPIDPQVKQLLSKWKRTWGAVI